jgi:hypothetical protein
VYCVAYLCIMEPINARKMKYIKIITSNLPVCLIALRLVFVFIKASLYVSLTSKYRTQIHLFFQDHFYCRDSVCIYWFFHVDFQLLYSDVEFR